MSYDFLMFKPTGPVDSPADLSDNSVVQSPETVMKELSALLPALRWEKAITGEFWQAQVEDEDGYYEFQIDLDPSQAWSVRTSLRSDKRPLISTICNALHVVAFDCQSAELIDEGGERST